MPDDNGQAPSLADRIRQVADPLIAQDLTPRQVTALTYAQTGIMVGPGGHSDPCQPPICPYCGACGLMGGCGGACPNLGRDPADRFPWADPAYDPQKIIAAAARKPAASEEAMMCTAHRLRDNCECAVRQRTYGGTAMVVLLAGSLTAAYVIDPAWLLAVGVVLAAAAWLVLLAVLVISSYRMRRVQPAPAPSRVREPVRERARA